LTLIEHQDLSCQCPKCEDAKLEFPREQSFHVQPWTLTRLKAINRVEVREAMVNLNDPMEFGSGGEEMAKDVLVGDNIVVFCQSFANESFWIMIVDKPLHMVI